MKSRFAPSYETFAMSALLAATLALSGCVIERHEHVVRDDLPRCSSPGVAAGRVWIDADERLQATPGEGAGVFVEYESGGRWHVWLTCDTAITGKSCRFDVFAQSLEGTIGGVVGDSLGPGDAVYQDCSDTAQLIATTRANIAGMYFETRPGAAVQFDVLLDGAPYPELVYWYGNHRIGDPSDVRYGAPGNPIDFIPNQR